MIHPGDTCDGFDNDQDGTVDEDFVPQTAHCDVGACARTDVTSRVDGTVVDDCQAGPPNSSDDASCDDLDDGCDGSVDKAYPSQPVTCGVGVCSRSGFLGCVNGAVQDTCAPGSPTAPHDATCDGLDDDCDGAIDEDISLPAGPAAVRLVQVTARSTELSWETVPVALAYDIVRGSVSTLTVTFGDFSAATEACLVDNLEATSWRDKTDPAVGDGLWYLVRAMNCVGAGSYDDGENGLVSPRDPEIAASPSACP